MCISLCVCGIVVEVNVVDTSINEVEDVTFPRHDPTRQSSWNAGGNSIRLTGDTIRELGADGWCCHVYVSECITYSLGLYFIVIFLLSSGLVQKTTVNILLISSII